jgi:predicted metal-dependent hydrolase
MQKDKVKYGTRIIPYYIVKSKRVKTSEIIVDANRVTIRTPINKDKRQIQTAILEKAGWILKKQKEYRETIPQLIKPTFKENSTLPYMGRNYPLRILRKQSENSIEFTNGVFFVQLKSSTVTRPTIKKLYKNWLRDKAEHLFKEKTGKYAAETGVMIEKILIKNLRNRWGSLTKNDKVINLNLNLIMAPEEVMDYIILHELCHLKIKEHSHHYWNLVRRYVPNYQEKINWLNINGAALI